MELFNLKRLLYFFIVFLFTINFILAQETEEEIESTQENKSSLEENKENKSKNDSVENEDNTLEDELNKAENNTKNDGKNKSFIRRIQPRFSAFYASSMPIGLLSSVFSLEHGGGLFMDVSYPSKILTFLGLEFRMGIHSSLTKFKGKIEVETTLYDVYLPYSVETFIIPLTGYFQLGIVTDIGLKPFFGGGGGITWVRSKRVIAEEYEKYLKVEDDRKVTKKSVDPTFSGTAGFAYSHSYLPYLEVFVQAHYTVAIERVAGHFLQVEGGIAYKIN